MAHLAQHMDWGRLAQLELWMWLSAHSGITTAGVCGGQYPGGGKIGLKCGTFFCKSDYSTSKNSCLCKKLIFLQSFIFTFKLLSAKCAPPRGGNSGQPGGQQTPMFRKVV